MNTAPASDLTIVALLALHRHGVPADVQELLVRGNPNIGARPGALAAAIAAIAAHVDHDAVAENADRAPGDPSTPVFHQADGSAHLEGQPADASRQTMSGTPATPGAAAQTANRPGIAELAAFGWAPGGYMIRCRVCGARPCDCDKRASKCRPCAEAAWASHTALVAAPLVCDEVCNVPEA